MTCPPFFASSFSFLPAKVPPPVPRPCRAIWRGAATLKNVSVHKIQDNEQVPFFQTPEADLSLRWAPLIREQILANEKDDRSKSEPISNIWVSYIINIRSVSWGRIGSGGGGVLARPYEL